MSDQLTQSRPRARNLPIRLTVGRKIGGVVAILLLLLIVVAVYALIQISSFGDDLDKATADLRVSQMAGSLEPLSLLRLAAVRDLISLNQQNRTLEVQEKATEAVDFSADIEGQLAALRINLTTGSGDSGIALPRYADLLPLVDESAELNSQAAEAAAGVISELESGRKDALIKAATLFGQLERATEEFGSIPINARLVAATEASTVSVANRQGDARTLILVATAIALVVGIAVSLFIVKRLTNSLAAISERAETIGDTVATDDFRHEPVHVNTSDEIQDLARIFNQMSSRLFQNIEERREIEQALADARDDAVDATRAKSDFLANMSHELRTPLNAIIGYSEMLQEEMEDLGHTDLIPDLERINSSGQHLLVLINDVLDLSKIEAGKMELFLEDFDIQELVDGVVTGIQPMAAQNSNRVKVNYLNDPGTARADATKVRQSLLNLLSNSSKFTKQGEITLDVSIEASDEGEQVIYKVTDTGIGMTKEQMGRLFQEFSQAETSISREYGGTGLGLALSQRFTQMMGGDITAESTYGSGSVFTIRMPRVVEEAPAAESPDEVAPAASITGKGIGTKVLVVDDDESVRDLLERFLTKEGYVVSLAPGGRDALKMAKEIRPDVITLDVLMPDVDGWTVLSSLKADPEVKDIPVIMLTIVEDKTTGFRLGADEFLTKPIDRDQLFALLAKYRDGGNAPVLLLEDDENTRTMTRRVLEKGGWKVMEASNGYEGIARVKEHKPAAILLDLMMPKMDGFEFLAVLRERSMADGIPIIVVTAKDLTEEDRSRLSRDVKKVLEKGKYTRDQLLQEVRDSIEDSLSPTE